MKKISTTIICVLFFILTVTAASANNASFSTAYFQPFSEYGTAASGLVLKNGELHFNYTILPIHAEEVLTINPLVEEDGEYEETPFRRFEIVFFISIPLTLALSFAGLLTYKAAAGTWKGWGNFENVDIMYLSLSTISLSLSVAIHDHRVVYKKRGT